MFGVFKSKALEARVSVLEEEIKKALDSKKEVMEASSEVIALQEKVQQSLEKQLKAAQRMVKSLSSQNRKLTRANKSVVEVVPKTLPVTITPEKAQEDLRIHKIKQVATKVVHKKESPKQIKVLGEITPRSVSFGELPIQDRAALVSDLLGEEVSYRQTSLFLVKNATPIRFAYLNKSADSYVIKGYKKDGYVIVPDLITNKFLITYLRVSDVSPSGQLRFKPSSGVAVNIRKNHAKTLQVLKDKLK